MPTVFREAGFRVVVYFNDHEPAHVHVIKAGGEIKINLLDSTSFEVWNMNDKNVKSARNLVANNIEYLLS